MMNDKRRVVQIIGPKQGQVERIVVNYLVKDTGGITSKEVDKPSFTLFIPYTSIRMIVTEEDADVNLL